MANILHSASKEENGGRRKAGRSWLSLGAILAIYPPESSPVVYYLREKYVVDLCVILWRVAHTISPRRVVLFVTLSMVCMGQAISGNAKSLISTVSYCSEYICLYGVWIVLGLYQNLYDVPHYTYCVHLL